LELKGNAPDRARALYEEVLKHHPGHVRTLVQLAGLEANQGRLDQAKARLEEAMRADPKALQPRLALAGLYLRQGKPAQALPLLQEVKDAYPDNPALLASLGEAHLANRNPGSALTALEKLVQVQPESARAHYLLARAYGETNDAERVSEDLARAIELDPNHLLSKVAMVRLLQQQRAPDEANKLVQELKQAQPDHPEVMALDGWLALVQGRPRDAVEPLEKAMHTSPSNQLAVYLALAREQAGDKDASVQTLESWLAQHPDDQLVRFNLGHLYLLGNRKDEAKATFAKVVEHSPDNAVALNNLAWLLREDDPAKALAYGRRAFDLAPGSASILDTLGTILLGQGQIHEALRLLREASQKMPKNGDIRYHLAQALAASGNKEGAQRVLREALSAKESFTERSAAEALLKSLGG
jgi:putative PEP-CTERM system TPR-repeat lipoprotein